MRRRAGGCQWRCELLGVAAALRRVGVALPPHVAAVTQPHTLQRHPTARPQDAASYASSLNLIYMDTSAKTGLNVRELFVAIGAWCGGLSVAAPASHRPRRHCHRGHARCRRRAIVAAKRLPHSPKTRETDIINPSGPAEPASGAGAGAAKPKPGGGCGCG